LLFQNITLKLLNEVFTTLKVPSIWLESIIVPIPKKGNLHKVENYRGIAFMSCFAKLYNRLILNRLKPFFEKILAENLAGFREKRSCRDLIHILRRILEGAEIKNLSLVATFVDFQKAFDSIYRPFMWDVLRSYGVPVHMVSAIKLLYDGNSVKIKVPSTKQLSEKLEVETGVLQGDTLAPYLFVIVMDYILKKTRDPNFGFLTHEEKGSRYRPRGKKVIHDLAFADDIVLLDQNIPQAQAHLSALQNAAASSGLQISQSKTEYMVVKHVSNTDVAFSLNGQPLKKVDQFKYLGSFVPDSKKDFYIRNNLAWSIFWSLLKIFKSELSFKLKYDLLRSTVFSILLYGSETWIISDKITKGLDVFQRKCFRILLGIRWDKHITNDALKKEADEGYNDEIPLLSYLLKKHQKKWIGHLIRSEVNLYNTYPLYFPEHGKRSRGGQKTSFIKEFAEQVLGNKEYTEDNIRNIRRIGEKYDR
jgi:hypothetical protein